MTAFESAWSVLKMPVVPYSLREVEPDGERQTRRNWRASFDDPVSGERLPVRISAEAEPNESITSDDDSPFIPTMVAGIGEKEKGYMGYDLEPARLNVHQYEPGTWLVGNSYVNDEVQRRGMATALYDLVASIIGSEYGSDLYGQSGFQSEDALALWESNLRGEPYDTDIHSWFPSRNLWRDRRDAA